MKIETVFLCFSSKDRYEIAESIYYHLENFGIPVWYDRKEILMGDNRYQKNFTEGVCACKYAIVILSPNSIDSTCANEEIDLIYAKYKAKKMYIFPVFYNITADRLPLKYRWMLHLVYKELTVSIDSRSLCNHITSKVLLDMLQNYTYKSISEASKVSNGYLKSLLCSYQEIDGSNFNARISLLYAGILYISNRNKIPDLCQKGTTHLFNETKLNLPIDLRETIIFERLFLIAINQLLA